jgi:uncharacterized membrane protein
VYRPTQRQSQNRNESNAQKAVKEQPQVTPQHIRAVILLGFLLAVPFNFPTAIADTAITSQEIVLRAYLDGFVQIDHKMELRQISVSVNATLLGQTHQNLLIIDENGLPLNYSLEGTTVVIYNIGSMKISVSYLTQDLTFKTGQYWTLSANYPQSLKLVLPNNASIISLSNVPDTIENTAGCLTITMPPGETEVTYTAEHQSTDETNATNRTAAGFELWQILLSAVLVLTVLTSAVAIRRLKPRKTTKPQPQNQQSEIDVDKLLSRHRELRQDEIQVIRYLATKNGKAFESELFELLNLPRTTTWRLIKRLEGMEIVHVKKSRRQNIVLVHEKYLKKQPK